MGPCHRVVVTLLALSVASAAHEMAEQDEEALLQVPKKQSLQTLQGQDSPGAHGTIALRLAQLKARCAAGISPCEEGDDVPCPSAPEGQGEFCAGNQCCRGPTNNPGATFPCPSASPSWDASGCAVKPHSFSCVEETTEYCQVQQDVKCPGPPYGQGEMCAGNQCCRGPIDEPNATFPCPSASPSWEATACAVQTQSFSCVDPCEGVAMLAQVKATVAKESRGSGASKQKEQKKQNVGCSGDRKKGTDYCSVGDHVQCPEQGEMCSGNQCCRGPENNPGATFPCPSASADWDGQGCYVQEQLHSCLDPCED